jgi:esterase/lipase superfamily enzyme
MNERHIRWWTPHMSRDFEMLIVGDARGLPLILFPTSFGRYRRWCGHDWNYWRDMLPYYLSTI